MTSRVGTKVKLTSVDELLCVPETQGTTDIAVDKIYPFENHPFKVLDDEKMEDLVTSIKENGILTPVIVRPDDEGTYEMISGHRRLHAATIAGLQKVPAIIKEMTDDDATLFMIDSNIQREELLPSEKAFAFRMKMEALNRQGKRTDLLNASGLKVPESSPEEIGAEYGMGGRQVKRYIRLTYLTKELLDMVDDKKLGVNLAVDISFFDTEIQAWLYEYMKENGFVKPEQITALKKQENIENITQYTMITIMNGALPEKKASYKVSISEKKLNKYFPSHYSAKQREDVILSLLEQWKNEQEDKA